MFTPTVLTLLAIIAILLVLNFRIHLDLKVTRDEATHWKTRGDNLNHEIVRRRQEEFALSQDIKRKDRLYDEQLKHLKAALEDKASELRALKTKASTLESVKFYARVPSYSGHQKTEFKLGLGPCGLVVKTLNMTEQADRIVIEQLCENGERKTFDYFKSDIEGRIEKRWAA
ncbi:hypothetical protein [Aeromonas phage JELG-KS1]|uniref:Uncharacterized protein n=1 Tax=Aeromonas phage JELG-KS1 TaxID=2951233 RepID=A0A9E7SYW4_9CAUD|nr:hypothetical protein [Aeromonas phage JELG-KS1]